MTDDKETEAVRIAQDMWDRMPADHQTLWNVLSVLLLAYLEGFTKSSTRNEAIDNLHSLLEEIRGPEEGRVLQ